MNYTPWKEIRADVRRIIREMLGLRDVAVTGWGDGSVWNPNRPNYIRVTFQESEIEVWNDNVPQIKGLQVYLEGDPKVPGLLWAVRPRVKFTQDFPFVSINFHRNNHTFGSMDPVDVNIRQFMPLQPYVASPFIVVVRGGWVEVGTEIVYFHGTQIDFNPHRPVGAGAKYVLVTMSQDAELVITDGVKKGYSELTISDIPALPEGHKRIFAVRLRNSQTRIEDKLVDPDLLDLRFGLSFASGSGGVEEAPVDGKLYGRADESWVEVIPTGGTEGQVLAKISDNDFESEWIDPPAGGGGGGGSSWKLIVDEKFTNLDDWFVNDGTWVIDGGVLRKTNAGYAHLRYQKIKYIGDCITEIEIRHPDAAMGAYTTGNILHGWNGLGANWSVAARLVFDSSGTWVQSERTAQVNLTSRSIPLLPQTWYKLRVVWGSICEIYIDDVLVQSFYPGGMHQPEYIGLRVSDAGARPLEFRNFKVWTLAGPEDSGSGGSAYSIPKVSDFSWIHQGSATATDDPDGIILKNIPETYHNHRILIQSLPSTPFRARMGYVFNGLSVAYQAWSMFLRESSSGKLINFAGSYGGGGAKWSLAINGWSNPTTHGMGMLDMDWVNPVRGFFEIRDDGTNRSYAISGDGVNYTDVYTSSRTQYLISDQIGFGVYSGQTSYHISLKVFHWKVEVL